MIILFIVVYCFVRGGRKEGRIGKEDVVFFLFFSFPQTDRVVMTALIDSNFFFVRSLLLFMILEAETDEVAGIADGGMDIVKPAGDNNETRRDEYGP